MKFNISKELRVLEKLGPKWPLERWASGSAGYGGGLGRKGQTQFCKTTIVLIAVQELETPLILEESLISIHQEQNLFLAWHCLLYLQGFKICAGVCPRCGILSRTRLSTRPPRTGELEPTGLDVFLPCVMKSKEQAFSGMVLQKQCKM